MALANFKQSFNTRATDIDTSRTGIITRLSSGKYDTDGNGTLGSLFKHSNYGNTRVGFPTYDKPEQLADAVKLIDTRYGFTLQSNRDKALAMATADPLEWLEGRDTHLREIEKIVTQAYATRMNYLERTGLSWDRAQQLSLEYADVVFEKQMQDLELLYPGQATIGSSVAHTMSNRDAKFAMANGAAESDKAVYKRYKTEKKARRGAK